MMRKTAALILAFVLAFSVSAAAQAATSSRHGITVRTPNSKTVYNGAKVKIIPSVHVKSGKHEIITRKIITAYKNGRRYKSGHSVRLPGGTYKLAVKVTYRTWKYVTMHRQVRVWHEGGYPDGSRCVVKSADNYPDSDSYFITNSDCTNGAYPGQTAHDEYTVTDTPGPYTEGQIVYSDDVEFNGYHSFVTKPYKVKKWTGHHHFTSAKRTLIVHNKTKHHQPAPVTHSCTTTSSGSCIRGGEFCPQASYGETGWDANGTAYVCTGDSTHPHWE